MAYEIHIERIDDEGELTGVPITLSEWEAAVEGVWGVRLASGDTVAANPSTGEVISIQGAVEDAEVFFAAESTWSPVYRWRMGRISFKGLPSFDDPDDVVRQKTRMLASALGARIIGDDGEFYE